MKKKFFKVIYCNDAYCNICVWNYSEQQGKS